LFLVHRFLSPWWRRRQVPPKRRFLQEPHGVTTQKTPFFLWRTVSQIFWSVLWGSSSATWNSAPTNCLFILNIFSVSHFWTPCTIVWEAIHTLLFGHGHPMSKSQWNFTTLIILNNSSGILRRVSLVRTDVSEEGIASIIRVTWIGEIVTLAVTYFGCYILLTFLARRLLSPCWWRRYVPRNVRSYKSHTA
jgi:hypothetical protein